MPGFGDAIRSGAYVVIGAFIAAFVARLATPLVTFLEDAPIVQASGTPDAITRTITFVDAATSRLLLIIILSVVVFWLARSYLNSEVNI